MKEKQLPSKAGEEEEDQLAEMNLGTTKRRWRLSKQTEMLVTHQI